MITDVGEHIPYSKKEILSGHRTSKPNVAPKEKLVSLKTVWPEPDWVALHIEGIPKDVLASIYSIYHSLAKRPHSTNRIAFQGERITIEMWEEAYIGSVEYLRQACENATTMTCIEELKSAFIEHFNNGGETTYKTYAAGPKTAKSFLHPLGNNGSASHYRKLLPLLDWPVGIIANKIKLFPVKLRNKANHTIVYRLAKINKKSVTYHYSFKGLPNEFATYEEAASALVETFEDEIKREIKSKDKEELELYVPKKQTHRYQGVSEQFKDVSVEALMQDFGFRGIQFGNYMPQAERQRYINNTYHSLDLLRQILRIDKEQIGKGELGLAFGSRGTGGASAHYEPQLNVINLTRFNGPGSIAHELFHHFDASFGRLWLKEGDTQEYMSELIQRNLADVTDVQSKFRNHYLAFEQVVKASLDISSFTDNAKAIGSQKRARKYWSRPCELCARAFESYVQDLLEAQGIKHQWLALGTLESDYPMNNMHPYPIGQDRNRINLAFSNNIAHVFQSPTDNWLMG